MAGKSRSPPLSPTVDCNAPAIRAIEAAIAGIDADSPADLVAADDEALADYPFRHGYWQPLRDRYGAILVGLLAVRATPFDPNDAARFERIGETAQNGWLALTGGRPVRRLPALTRRRRRVMLVAAALVACLPAHLSVLAPVEVAAAAPFLVTAPFAGVVAHVDVAPNQPVARGQALLRFDDIKPRNEASLAA